MTDDTMTLASLRAYLDELSSEAPDRVLKSAISRIESTPQRHNAMGWFPLSPLAFAGAAASVLVIGVLIGVILGSRLDGPTPANTPAPSILAASPTPSPTPTSIPTPAVETPSIETDPPATPSADRLQTTSFRNAFSYELPSEEYRIYLENGQGWR